MSENADQTGQTGAEPGPLGPGVDRIEHLPAQRRFVLTRESDGHTQELAHVEYVTRDGVWVFTHTFTEPAARGLGLAAQVVRDALDTARQQGVQIGLVCPYVRQYVAEHPEYADLVAAR